LEMDESYVNVTITVNDLPNLKEKIKSIINQFA